MRSLSGGGGADAGSFDDVGLEAGADDGDRTLAAARVALDEYQTGVLAQHRVRRTTRRATHVLLCKHLLFRQTRNSACEV